MISSLFSNCEVIASCKVLFRRTVFIVSSTPHSRYGRALSLPLFATQQMAVMCRIHHPAHTRSELDRIWSKLPQKTPTHHVGVLLCLQFELNLFATFSYLLDIRFGNDSAIVAPTIQHKSNDRGSIRIRVFGG